MSARPGDSFGGYVIESLLARGGMGAVYLATHVRLGRKAALKLIAPEFADDRAFRSRFLRESELAAALDHPNVIPIYDAGETDGVLYLAMRYVRGSSLQAVLRERGSLPLDEALRLADQIGGALDAAHAAGLVHRDVKPANIMLAEPDTHAYLCDFGLAKRASAHGITQAGSFLGTVDFSSPEQIEGLPLDGRADLYSLGCVVYNCLTGRPPYLRDTDLAVLHAHLHAPPPAVTAERPELPRALDVAVATAMAKEPGERYPTGAAFAAALRGRTEQPTRVTVRPRRVGRRWPIAAALAAGAVAVAAVILVVARGPSDSSSASGVATFVDRIENVLAQSSAGRQEITNALAAGFACSISSRETSRRIASAGDNRQSIVQQLGTLATPTEQAARLVTLLQQALQESIEADRHYRDGFAALGAPGPRCAIARTGDFRLAAQADARATAAKQRFVAAFDPLAVRYGRRTWSARKF